MNVVVITGRLTKDPDVRHNDKSVGRFTLAVDRDYKREGEQNADFISCVAFGKTADFLEKYFSKGKRAEVNGRIQTGSYKNKDGQTVYTTDVVVEKLGFGESKKDSESHAQASNDGGFDNNADEGFMNVPDDVEESLPFV